MTRFTVVLAFFLLMVLTEAHVPLGFLHNESLTDCWSFFKLDRLVAMETSWLKMNSSKYRIESGSSLDLRVFVTSPHAKFEEIYLLAQDDESSDYLGTFVVDNRASIVSCLGGYQAIEFKQLPSNNLIIWKSPSDFNGFITFRAIIARGSIFYTEKLTVPIQIQQPILLETTMTNSQGTMTSSLGPNEELTSSSIKASSTDTLHSESTSEADTDPTSSATSPISTTSITTTIPPPLPPVYDECKKTKGCFAYPENCIERQNCTMFVSYQSKESSFEIELYGNRNIPSNFYVAIGFSADSKMGDDSVIECASYGGQVKAFTSFNIGETNRRVNTTVGFQILEARMINREMYCKVLRSTDHVIESIQFDLNQPQHLLLASGSVVSQTQFVLLRHDITSRTDSAIDLNNPSIVGGSQEILRKLHSSFMIISWMWAASIGVVCARHFKPILKQNVCGKDLWFTIHRSSMVLTWILSIIGFIVIFVEVGGWSSYTAHAVLGCITVALVFMQPIIAAYRPLPNTPRRPLFKWIHSNVGNVAHLMAVSCIFLALDMKKVAAADWALYLLIAHVVLYCFSRGLLTLIDLISKLKSDLDKASEEKVSDVKSKVPRIKKWVLTGFCFVSLASSIAMIIAVIQ